MADHKARLGKDQYYKILGLCGFEHADEILVRRAQLTVHHDMKAATPVVNDASEKGETPEDGEGGGYDPAEL